MAVISNCYTENSIRMDYTQDINKYFTVDGFGSCFNNIISNERFNSLCKKYKFYLAFENSVCDDYITEKYCTPLRCGTIPIIMSYKHNLVNLIPGSYINAFDYHSPEHLAEYLFQIVNNFTLYKSYFEWKKHYKVTSCRIHSKTCEMVDIIFRTRKFQIDDQSVSELLDESTCLSAKNTREYLYRNV
ncbi:Alpha-(1,3)-fucosyltransferase 10 [Thelohanellus kitauei]|uniref:Fucosyltransferase n=1 Tax=Thelohanellus kitauei TaxID=669202 RepID=A0A0C2MK71_THEKT|nr:Alpha-(1,3)-fucosyltransferase 10 [Thelohanellus kitauei]